MLLLMIVAIFFATVNQAFALTPQQVVTKSFSSAATGGVILLRDGETLAYADVGSTNVGTVLLERSFDGQNFDGAAIAISTRNNSGTFSGTLLVQSPTRSTVWYRWRQSVYTSGTSATTLTESDNLIRSSVNNNGDSVRDDYDQGQVFNGYLKIANAGGPFHPAQRTKAQLYLIAPAAGDVYLCTDCARPYTQVNATGTAVDQFREQGLTTGVQ